jgi:hypothetical protein
MLVPCPIYFLKSASLNPNRKNLTLKPQANIANCIYTLTTLMIQNSNS